MFLAHPCPWRPAKWLATLMPALLLGACSLPFPPSGGPTAPPQTMPTPPAPGPAAPAQPAPPAIVPGQPPTASQAATARAYRQDAARHLYAHNALRIWKGKLQPNLYAIGVLEVDIDARGRVTATRWMRAPQHAPEVMAEILRTVRAAAPYPVPARMGRVTYTDVWLWDRSGQFQLDTLTEGQL